ncbi:MAG: hypothetical protein JWN04_6369 [Myxococcaceae bacterium]|nr:hypothetical protein [Myxococcaceae bacterium]
MAGIKNILLATDFGDASDAAMSTAFELAQALDATVHVLHVFTLQDNTLDARMSAVGITELQKQLEAKVQALLGPGPGAGRLGRVLTHFGAPAPLVLRTAEELPADMIVLGSHGRQGIARLLLGSVAEAVVREAKCPVLVAKPKGLGAERAG